MRDLLEAGVHFGHRTPRWNPKMRPYIFGARGGVHIVDLQHTVRGLATVQSFIRALAAEGGDIIFVGTKQQAQEAVREEAERCGAHYVQHRWLGGTLTNFDTIRTRVQRLRELQAREQAGDLERMSKKAVHAHQVETARLEKRMGGIRNLSKLPAALYIVDPKREDIAVAEARRLNIPVIALTDTNCDPELVDYVIPGNDDAIRAVRAITEQVADAVLAGREAHEKREAERALQAAREAEAAMAAAAQAEKERASAAELEAAMLAAAAEEAQTPEEPDKPVPDTETAAVTPEKAPAAPASKAPATSPTPAAPASKTPPAKASAKSSAAPRGRRKPKSSMPANAPVPAPEKPKDG
jgi:small subunit ribosomal protein S2